MATSHNEIKSLLTNCEKVSPLVFWELFHQYGVERNCYAEDNSGDLTLSLREHSTKRPSPVGLSQFECV